MGDRGVCVVLEVGICCLNRNVWGASTVFCLFLEKVKGCM